MIMESEREGAPLKRSGRDLAISWGWLSLDRAGMLLLKSAMSPVGAALLLRRFAAIVL